MAVFETVGPGSIPGRVTRLKQLEEKLGQTLLQAFAKHGDCRVGVHGRARRIATRSRVRSPSTLAQPTL